MYDSLEHGLFIAVQKMKNNGTYSEKCEEYALSKLRKMKWYPISKSMTGKIMNRAKRKLNEKKVALILS